jgi:membrane dipeptidase
MKPFILALVVLLCGGLVFLDCAAPSLIEKRMNRVLPHTAYQIRPEVAALHASIPVSDLHDDALLWKRDLTKRSARGHLDIPRLVDGGVALQVFTAVTKSPAGQNYEENDANSDDITILALAQMWPPRTWGSLFERARFQSDKLRELERRAPGHIRYVTSRRGLEDVLARRARGQKLTAALFGIEGAHPLEGDLANLGRLHDEGLRVMGFTHFFDNELGGSLHGQSHAGLTEFGRQVLREANQRKIILDVAHLSPAGVRDVLNLSNAPVILSHGGVKAACDTPRNLDDDLMRALAAHGGLLGVGFWDGAVCDISPEGVARAIRHAVDLMGVNHVALGSDYDGTTEVSFDAGELPVLTQTLLDAGFTQAEVRKVMGENVVAFFRANLESGVH